MTREGHDDEQGHELRPVQTGVGEVQDAVKELETAAWREGIDPEGLLGTFVLAQGRLLVKTAHLLERAEAAIGAEVEAVRKLGEIELAKVRENPGWYWSNRRARRSLPRKCNMTMRSSVRWEKSARE